MIGLPQYCSMLFHSKQELKCDCLLLPNICDITIFSGESVKMKIKRDTLACIIVVLVWILSAPAVAVEFAQIAEFDIPEANQGVGGELLPIMTGLVLAANLMVARPIQH